jgi:hypothetical protein
MRLAFLRVLHLPVRLASLQPPALALALTSFFHQINHP